MSGDRWVVASSGWQLAFRARESVVVDVHAPGCAKVPKGHNEKGRTLLAALKPKE
jgi:hypothetical protein